MEEKFKKRGLLRGLPLFVPRVFMHEIAEETRLVQNYTGDESKEYTLDRIQRIFILFEHPGSCQLGILTALFTALIVLLNIIVFIIASCPSYQETPATCDSPACDNDPILCPGRMICQPIPRYTYQHIETACIICFTAHYLIRVLTCWSVTPRLAGLTANSRTGMSKSVIVIRYILKWNNIVDICAIVPLYAFLAQSHHIVIDQNSGFVRILWLPLLFKVVGKSMKGPSAVSEIFFKTMDNSAPALLFTLFFISIGTVVFASIIYVLEKGVFEVTANYPMGAFYRSADILGDNNALTKFTSIPVSMYFTVVTTTSLGYGDIVPRTAGGLVIACLLCILGVCVLALPIAVIGGNFAALYAAYVIQKKEKEDLFLLQKSRTELNAIEVASLHEKQCRLVANAAESVSHRSRSQAETFARATGLLSIIIERTRRMDLSDVMCSLGDFRSLPRRHRSQQPATSEQMRKWNAAVSPPSARSTIKTLISLSSKDLMIEPGRSNASLVTYFSLILTFPYYIVRTLISKVFYGDTFLVPRVYVFKAPSDMYFPERLYVLNWYQRIFLLFQESTSCVLASMIHWFNTAVILLGIAIIFISSTAKFRITPATCHNPACHNDSVLCPNQKICESEPIKLLQYADTFVVAVFTVDYGIRVLISGFISRRLASLVPEGWDAEEIFSARRQGRAPTQDPPPLSWIYQTLCYCTVFYNVIDMLTILPFYITVGAPGATFLFLRVLSLLRVLRLLRLTKNSPYTKLLVKSMGDSIPVLTTFAVFVGFGIVVLACLINVVEDGIFRVSLDYPKGDYMRPSILRSNDEPSPFHSIPDALYFVVITTATVGYGDIYATTHLGRFFACMMAYVGIFTWTFPLAIIGYNFVMGHEKLLVDERDMKNQAIGEALREANQLSDDVCSADILAEVITLLMEVSADSAYISECSEALIYDSPALSTTASQLRYVLSPAGVWS